VWSPLLWPPSFGLVAIHLKKASIIKLAYKICDLARADLFGGMKVFYDWSRRLSDLGWESPEEFELATF